MSSPIDPVGDFRPTINLLPQKDFIPWEQLTRYGGGSATPLHPFKVVDISDVGHPRRIKVSPGLINSTVPQIGGTDIDSIPAPTLDLPSNTSRSLFAKLTVTTAGVLSSVELVLMTSDPTDSSAILGYQKIAVITTETAITNVVQYVTSSLGYRRCRSSDHVFWAL